MEENKSDEGRISEGLLAQNEDPGYLETERARLERLQQPLDEPDIYLPRAIVKLHQPVHLKVLALLRTGVGANLMSQKLVRQLNLSPSPTTWTKCEPIDGHTLVVYGELRLKFTMVDTTGEERSFNVPFLAVDLYGEEMVLGMSFLCGAGLNLSIRRRACYWSANNPED